MKAHESTWPTRRNGVGTCFHAVLCRTPQQSTFAAIPIPVVFNSGATLPKEASKLATNSTSFPFIEPTGHIHQFIDIRQSILRMSVQILLQFLSITHYPCLRELALERRPLWLSLFTAHQELHQSETAYKISDQGSNTVQSTFWPNVNSDFVWSNEGFLNRDRPQFPFQQYLCDKVLFQWISRRIE